MSWVRAIAVLIAVAALAWVCAEAAPGTAGQRAARAAGLLPADDASIPAATREAIVGEVERDLGLDRSFARRLAGYLAGLATLDLGRSWRDGAPVRGRVGDALGPTLVLIVAALLVALGLGVGAALWAVYRGGAADALVSAAAAAAIAVPPAWIALIALRTFATGSPWRWLPPGGLDSLAAGVLPVVSLAVVPGFILARYARAALIERLDAPWTTAARARGASMRRVVLVHALRAALASLVAVAVTLFAYLLGASLVIERVFSIRVLGALVLDAAARGDAPVVVGATVAAGALLALVSLGADALQRVLDPRLRQSPEETRGA